MIFILISTCLLRRVFFFKFIYFALSANISVSSRFAYISAARPNRDYIGNYLQKKKVAEWETSLLGQRNEFSSKSIFDTFSTVKFSVSDSEGNLKFDVDFWYQLKPDKSYTITKYATMPFNNFYSDIELEKKSTFSSYIERRRDTKIQWRTNRQLEISTIHDTGVDKASEMLLNTVVIEKNNRDNHIMTR